MTVVVFLGPSLPVDVARQTLDATYLPPVQQGDILRALALHAPTAIGIVDGYFDRVPSVWHKEILYALETGVTVFGASSMGALRAAELHPFGMIGVGRVFEWYRDAVLEADDEVAIVHAPAEDGWRPLSVALVDIRDVLKRAVDAGDLDEGTAAMLLVLVKRRYYPERSWPQLLLDAREAGITQAVLDVVDDHRRRAAPGLKARDAIALLERLARRNGDVPIDPTKRGWRLERTVFFERLRSEVAGAEFTSLDLLRTHAADASALFRSLVRREAARRGITVTAQEVQAAADDFRRRRGLDTADKTWRWLAETGLDERTFTVLARDLALLTQVERRLLADDNRPDDCR